MNKNEVKKINKLLNILVVLTAISVALGILNMLIK